MDACLFSSYDEEKHKKEVFPMSKDTETLKHDAEVAQFRFALIVLMTSCFVSDLL